LKSHKIDDSNLIRLSKEICAGMIHLHTEAIIHRDLAARNILLTETLNSKITDFGFARVVESQDTPGQTETVVGPLKWMSIESIQKQEYSTKSDVWAFGITVIEIMTSSLPYPGELPVNVASKVVSGFRLTPPSDRPKELAEILVKCWQTEPSNRPEFTEIYDELNQITI